MHERLIKNAIGVHITPLYDVAETKENKEMDCLDDKSPYETNEHIAPGYDHLYLGPIRRMKYSSLRRALDYSSLSPFVQHQYGVGYDGNNSMNRSEFPRNWPWQRHNYYTKIEDGDYDESEYSESNPSLFPGRDEGQKYRDTDYTNLDDNRTRHYREHQMQQNELELLGSMENIIKLATIDADVKELMRLLQGIHDVLERYEANEIIQYALGGIAYIVANYKHFDETKQQLYDHIIYNALHDTRTLKSLLSTYFNVEQFKENPVKYMTETIKNKYHNLYQLVKIGE